jgi:hypothetical protein
VADNGLTPFGAHGAASASVELSEFAVVLGLTEHRLDRDPAFSVELGAGLGL